MHKRQIIFIISLTLIIVVALNVVVALSLNSVNRYVKESSFTRLKNSSIRLAGELHDTKETDVSMLGFLADVIASSEQKSNESLAKILAAYNAPSSAISYVELLLPDNTMLDSDGTVRDVSSSFDFGDEVKKGYNISNIEYSTKEKERKVIRNAVPVVIEGKTAYILYGVVDLMDFAGKYTAEIFDGNAYIYVIDCDSGDFIIDTWHKTLGDFNTLGDREMLDGYDYDKMMSDLRNGKSGDTSFKTKTTGIIMYLHYEPVGINNWSLMLAVEEPYVMEENSAISQKLLLMAGFIGLCMMLYVTCVTVCLFLAYRQV